MATVSSQFSGRRHDPHWCPEPFVSWPGYAALWSQAVAWLAGVT
jgi:uncharacterized membrane protein